VMLDSRPLNRVIGRTLVYALLIVGGIIMVVPFLWMFSAAFKPLAEVIRVPPTWIPERPLLDNFYVVWVEFKFFRYFANSVIVAAITVLFVLATSSMAGYALAKFDFGGKDLVFILILSSLMVPFQTRLIPLYRLTTDLGLADTLPGVIFPWIVDAFGIYLMRQFMLSIPSDLIEAARIDGAGELRIFFQIVIPLVKPALSALAILTLVVNWEEFLWPLVITNSDASRTLPVGLQAFAEQYAVNTHWQMAGAAIAILPMIVVFLIFQRHFIRGIAMTGLK
jgi:multiple sugar transport system permease protein